MKLRCAFVDFFLLITIGGGVRLDSFHFNLLSSQTQNKTNDELAADSDSSCGKRSFQWKPDRQPKVVGGQEPPIGAIPWQIDLRVIDDKHYCGGALISRRLVLSAAHCYNDGLRAVAGAHGFPGSSPHEQTLRVEKFIPHPDFRKLGAYSHDLAVLLVEEPGFDFNQFVKPACFSDDSPPSGTWCEVSGWGAVDPNDVDTSSLILKVAAVPVISLDTCRLKAIYGGKSQQILDSMLCAGYLKGGIDACSGDSGGPLVCEIEGKMEVTGIVSWGEGCAKKNKPGVYTRVSSFLPWIKDCANDLGVDL
ncbi:trypsin-like [Diorhabda sublineata]|uniref:trypsin-like n=1 Tax=Diorhabda sublineata TaxID=1163346 RepID=UPI0024E12923|nr:trypsin-like [Diorhabda sublineata]